VLEEEEDIRDTLMHGTYELLVVLAALHARAVHDVDQLRRAGEPLQVSGPERHELLALKLKASKGRRPCLVPVSVRACVRAVRQGREVSS
jgi:hypothetical protein